MNWLTESKRAWVYNTVLASAPLLVFYGVVSNEEVVLWAGWLAAVLGVGLARANVTTKGE